MTDFNNIDDAFREQQHDWDAMPANSAWSQLTDKLDDHHLAKVRKRRLTIRWSAVASIVMLIGIGLTLFNKNLTTSSDFAQKNEIKATENGAVVEEVKSKSEIDVASINDSESNESTTWADASIVDHSIEDNVVDDGKTEGSYRWNNGIGGNINEEFNFEDLTANGSASSEKASTTLEVDADMAYDFTTTIAATGTDDEIEVEPGYFAADYVERKDYKKKDKSELKQIGSGLAEINDKDILSDSISGRAFQYTPDLTIAMNSLSIAQEKEIQTERSKEQGKSDVSGIINVADDYVDFDSKESEQLPATVAANTDNISLQKYRHERKNQQSKSADKQKAYSEIQASMSVRKTMTVLYPNTEDDNCDYTAIQINESEFFIDECQNASLMHLGVVNKIAYPLKSDAILQKLYQTGIYDLREIENEINFVDCDYLAPIKIVVQYGDDNNHYEEFLEWKQVENCYPASVKSYIKHLQKLLQKY